MKIKSPLTTKICKACGSYNVKDAIFCRCCGFKPCYVWQWGFDMDITHSIEVYLDAYVYDSQTTQDSNHMRNRGISNIISTLSEHKLKNEIK